MDEREVLRIDLGGLDALLKNLKEMGYKLIGPKVSGSAILYDEISSIDDLPRGRGDEQAPGRYRLRDRGDQMLFGYTSALYSWRRFLHPPMREIYAARRTKRGDFELEPKEIEVEKLALIGVRACELKALKLLDKVFLQEEYLDPYYNALRKNSFIIAVNCIEPGGTCFCTTMKTGPRVDDGYDLALTEIIQDGDHYFILEVGSDAGSEAVKEIPSREALESEKELAERLVRGAETAMKKRFDLERVKEALEKRLKDPMWDEIVKECLMCGNCTQVCPTCFCTTTEDYTDLRGEKAWRIRRWDSCVTLDFSYIVGGPVRESPSARYRHWLMHKFANWIEQFGEFGCVGCGRCITWCPVGIDITEIISKVMEAESG